MWKLQSSGLTFTSHIQKRRLAIIVLPIKKSGI